MFEALRTLLIYAVKRCLYRRARSLAVITTMALSTTAICLSLTLIRGRAESLLPPSLFKVSIQQRQLIGTAAAPIFTADVVNALQREVPASAALAGYNATNQAEIRVGAQRYILSTVLEGTEQLPRVLGVRATAGNLELDSSQSMDGTTLLLENSFAVAAFGSAEDAVGKRVYVHLPLPGVAPTSARVRGVYLLNDSAVGRLKTQAILGLPQGQRASGLMVRAKSNAAGVAREQVTTFLLRSFKELITDGATIAMSADTSAHAHPEYSVRKLDPTLVIFTGFGVVLIVSSILGVFATGIANSVERERDRALRVATGAGFGRIVAEGMTDALLLGLLGAILGLALALLTLAGISSMAGPYLFGRSLQTDWNVLVQSFALSVAVTLAASIFPVAMGARVKPGTLFREA